MTYEQIVDLLNEDEKLKQKIAQSVDIYQKVEEENKIMKQMIQKYYDTTTPDGRQMISDLVDMFEMKGVDVSSIDKEWLDD